MYYPQVGDPLSSLDTPAMIVDIELMNANIAAMMRRMKELNVGVRPHLKTTKSPELARLMLADGALGFCVAKVSEAEVMAQAGIEDLLITTEIIGAPKLARLVALVREHPQIKVVVDSLVGAQGLQQAMYEAKLDIKVLLDLNVGQNRTGVQPGEAALMLAQQIRKMDNLQLIGLQGYEGHLQHVHDAEERDRRCRESMRLLTDMADRIRAAGFPLEIVTTGGTGTAEICARTPGITDVQPGSFIFMDTDYRNALGPVYSNALTILSTIISKSAPDRVVADAGLKALSIDSGMPELKGHSEVTYRPGGDEHGILSWDKRANTALSIGERVEFLPSHIDTTINLHDAYYAYRDGIIVAIWPVAARGKVQ
jgi:D-serine deaminase-like pyridoxal phosphate-dependent protein